jgi:hypothetical protein
MSGWTHREDREANIQIAGRNWIDEVRRLCEVVGHDLEPHSYDQGESGRYHACHAEKQLIAFLINKHIFLPHETEGSASLNELSDKEYARLLCKLGVEELLDEKYDQLQKEREHKKELSDLKSVEPRTPLKKATILVCRRICRDCERFVKRINLALGLEVTIFHRCLELNCRYAEYNANPLPLGTRHRSAALQNLGCDRDMHKISETNIDIFAPHLRGLQQDITRSLLQEYDWLALNTSKRRNLPLHHDAR